MKRKTPKRIYVASDATGETAERLVRATMAQFPDTPVKVEVVGNVADPEQIHDLIRRAKRSKGLVAYTLVDKALRQEMASLANEAGVIAVDLIGPLMTSLSAFLSAAPAHQPGLWGQADREYYRRLDAMSYAVRHDDGLNLGTLGLADIVIVGPSRTSKTPLCTYLALTRGLRSANVPLIRGMEPPEELDSLDSSKVVGLTMNRYALSSIRKARAAELGAEGIAYDQEEDVREDLKYCHEIYRRHPAWRIIDMTSKSIEEVTVEICGPFRREPK